MRKTIIEIILIGLFTLSVPLALVYSGTQMIWVETFCGMLTSIVVGIGEGFLISAVFKTRRIRTILLMVATYYLSIIPGLLDPLILVAIFKKSDFLYHLKLAAVVSLLYSYATMVLLGWPFCLMAMKGQRKIFRRSFLASLLAQTVLYAIIGPLYCWATSSGLKRIDIDRNLVAQTQPGAVIYYISDAENNLCKIRVNGTGQEDMMKLEKEDHNGTLFAQKNTENAWDLWLSGAGPHKEKRLLLKNFTRNPVSVWENGNESLEKREWLNPLDFRPEKDRNWRVWCYAGIFYTGNERTSETLDLLFPPTPFGSWNAYSPVALPGDRAVFQLGPQIVLVDLNQWKMGLVATGRGLVVVWEGEPPRSPNGGK